MPTRIGSQSRRLVGVLGQTTRELDVALSQRRLECRAFELTAALGPEGNSLRALIIPYDDGETDAARLLLTKQLRQLIPTLLNRGTMLVVWARTEAGQAPAILVRSNVVGQPRNRDHVVVHGGSPDEIAQTCLEFQPEREQNPDLDIVGEPNLSDEERALLQRAFGDFASIQLVRLPGGSRRVWRIEPTYAGTTKSPEPFILKIGHRDQIRDEMSNYVDFCAPYVSFPNVAPIVSDRCVQGYDRAALVSMFVDRARRLDFCLPSASACIAIASLFDGPLRTWRESPAEENIALFAEYQRCGALPLNAACLNRAYDLSRAVDPDVLTPAALYEQMAAVGRVQERVCHSHGDLHTRNVFVRENGVDVILIDVARVSASAPASRDPATLEVSMAFEVPSEHRLALETLRKLFEPRLLARIALGSRNVRVRAIEQVRLQARATCDNVLAYDFAVGAYLLRRACARHDGDAYLCAASLIGAIRERGD